MFKSVLNNATNVDPTGKIYLKKKIRELVGIKPGDTVRLLADEEEQEILIKVNDNKEVE